MLTLVSNFNPVAHWSKKIEEPLHGELCGSPVDNPNTVTLGQPLGLSWSSVILKSTRSLPAKPIFSAVHCLASWSQEMLQVLKMCMQACWLWYPQHMQALNSLANCFCLCPFVCALPVLDHTTFFPAFSLPFHSRPSPCLANRTIFGTNLSWQPP